MDTAEMQARILQLEARMRELEKQLAKETPPPAKGKLPSMKIMLENEAREASNTPLPLLLNTEAFRPVWAAYCKKREQWATIGHPGGKRQPWTQGAATRILKKCEKLKMADAIDAIEESTERGWLDIFPERTAPHEHRSTASRPQHTGGLNAGRYGGKGQ